MLKEIAAHTQLHEYQRGDVFFWEGDPCTGLHIIEQGSAKIYRLSPQGRQYIVRVLAGGRYFCRSARLRRRDEPCQCRRTGDLPCMGD